MLRLNSLLAVLLFNFLFVSSAFAQAPVRIIPDIKTTRVDVDSLRLDGNTLSSTAGNLILDPNGALQLPDITASRVLTTNGSNAVTASAVTTTELGYLTGVTGDIQTQINTLTAADTSINTTLSGKTNLSTLTTKGDIYVATGASTVIRLAAGGTAGHVLTVDSAEPSGLKYAAVSAAEVTGVVKDYMGSTAPTGYVLASGRTIGSASSGATERANADTLNLYTLLWNSVANTELAIQDSSGVASTRGASAAADFAANKRLPLPDLRGRTSVGKDDMGGSAASRMTSGGAGIVGSTLGASGGAQTHTLTAAQIPAHTHNINLFYNDTGFAGADYVRGSANGGGESGNRATDSNTGGGGAHNITQPSYVVNKIIAL